MGVALQSLQDVEGQGQEAGGEDEAICEDSGEEVRLNEFLRSLT